MIISEKYAIDAYLSYIIAKNNNEPVEKIFIYYYPQIRAMADMLKRNGVKYKRENHKFYLGK